MGKGSFFSTEMGQQALAGILSVLSFPVIYCGLKFSVEWLAYVGLALIVIGLGMAPAAMLLPKKK